MIRDQVTPSDDTEGLVGAAVRHNVIITCSYDL
jgi:hypothetical protein